LEKGVFLKEFDSCFQLFLAGALIIHTSGFSDTFQGKLWPINVKDTLKAVSTPLKTIFKKNFYIPPAWNRFLMGFRTRQSQEFFLAFIASDTFFFLEEEI